MLQSDQGTGPDNYRRILPVSMGSPIKAYYDTAGKKDITRSVVAFALGPGAKFRACVLNDLGVLVYAESLTGFTRIAG